MSHIVVARCHPVQYIGIRLLIVLIAIALLWGAFELGFMMSEEALIEAKGGRTSLIVQQKVLKKKNKELNKELLHLERKLLIEKEASALVKSAMSRDQEKIAELEKELQFYKSIVSPGNKEKSLYLQNFEISPALVSDPVDSKETGSQYQYQFILAQKMKKRTYTKGSVKIFINGKQNNKETRLSMDSLLTDGSKAKKDKQFKFSFKYFQKFEGIITFPEKFIPESVDIKVSAKKEKLNIELSDLVWSQSKGIKYVGK